MLIALTHETTYEYDRSVQLTDHTIRLRPAPYCKLPIKAYSLAITPNKHYINWQHDPLGNHIANVNFFEQAKSLKITVDLIVDKISINPFDFFIEKESLTLPVKYKSVTQKILQPYLSHKYCNQLEHWFYDNEPNTQNTLDYLVHINNAVQNNFVYKLRFEPGTQTPQETLSLGSGSCRDLAWFQCVLLRQLGFATRFVSGYLLQLIDADENPNVDQDTLELHAWCEVFIPGAGWIGFDATSGLLAADNHIPLCAAADPSEAAAISGDVTASNSLLNYKMSLRRLSTPSVSNNAPLNSDQWQHVNQVAEQIDKHLAAKQMNLTIGGEPTYVHKNDLDDPQWQTAALGDKKLQLGIAVNHDLQKIFAPNGISIKTQGKWYPNEVLPRWACHTFWRKDHEPLWADHSLLKANNDKPHSLLDAKQLLHTIAGFLKINLECIKPIYEDAVYQLWLVGKLGKNIDLSQHKLTTHDNQSLSKTLYDNNLSEATGYCLPLAWDIDEKKWFTCDWQTNSDYITALPGESSLGHRLPLDKLAAHFDDVYRDSPEKSSFDPDQMLAKHDEIISHVQNKASDGKTINKFIRCGLCIEIRNNSLFVFIPPIKPLSAYCELLAAIEISAKELKLNISLEGYSPTCENKLNSFSVTPDPGVLEINIQPANNWQEMVSIHHILSEVTSKHGLISHKFSLDGRKISTGGGCHITLGGPTPEESPFLKKPEILQSMLTFWQHHPSLSYLFSGLFVGPTSQAPRIDEARHDALYELELAFISLPQGDVENFWLSDRLLRHLLVDVTGNTHRSEFCIDKLFSPDHERGRLGLIELRAFEMQIHPQLNCLQFLLVKTLATIFNDDPYKQNFHRWSTELHDRFMLPHFIWNDFSKVIKHIKHAGFNFNLDWFQPLFNFRFPIIGTAAIQDVQLELRHALEPWPALGEESQNGHTSRLVDSTLERIQLTCTGLNPEKYAITCNGIQVPLKKTSTQGVTVAGIRFKAWNFNNCLHPNISAIPKLVFDVIDKQLKRSVGGCQYFNQHPGGKNPEQLPINQREADTRQRARFEPLGHTPGIVEILQPIANPEHPYTLDLRQPLD